MKNTHRVADNRSWALSIILALGLGTACGSGDANSLQSNCSTLCRKVASAGCMTESECASSCEDTSTLPSACVADYESLIECGATEGTVGCTSGGESIGGCQAQAAAVNACATAGG